MMVCATCGTELRVGANFCNRCGTRVAQSATPIGDPMSPATASAPAITLANETASAPRPQGATITTQLDKSPTLILPTSQHAPGDSRGAAATTASTAPEMVMSPLVSSPAAPGRAYSPDDQLPWPLVVGIILDGRYRVEAIVQAGDAQNTYAVTDLRGYEQCWACGQVYGSSAASERYCRECGADLFARELVMVERPLAPGEPPHGPEAGQAVVPADQTADADVRRFTQSGRAYEVRPKAVRHAKFPLGARIIAGATSDSGRARAGETNEDSALVIVLDRIHESRTQPLGLFVVADGLGGHASGNRASRQAIDVIAHTILRQLALPLVGSPSDPVLQESELVDLLTAAVRDANLALCANNKESGQDAGSTLVAALLLGDTAYVANVGDSRAYVLDQHGLRRITSDHSLVQQLVAGGLIEPDEVYTHPQRNQILRSLGDDPDVTVDVFVQQLSPSMRLLLCSDGLWEMVRDVQIEELLRTGGDPQTTCDHLIDAANTGGGEDNVTAVVVEVR